VNRGFDAGLRRLFLEHLDRDLRFARLGVLGDVVMPTRWPQIRRAWRYHGPRGVVITVHDVPMSSGCGSHPLPPGPPGRGAPPAVGFGAPPAQIRLPR
jgi:hypothetical protein